MNVLAPPQKPLHFLHLSCFLLRDSHTRNDIFGSEAVFLTLKEGYLALSVGGSGFDGCVLGLTYRGTAAAACCNRATAARNAMITTCSAFILQQTSECAGGEDGIEVVWILRCWRDGHAKISRIGLQ